MTIGPEVKRAILAAAGINSNTILPGMTFRFLGDNIVISLEVAMPVTEFFAAGGES